MLHAMYNLTSLKTSKVQILLFAFMLQRYIVGNLNEQQTRQINENCDYIKEQFLCMQNEAFVC
jgi:hypothetical protein